jgi:membrane dipeptidase
LNLIDFHCDTIYKLRKDPSHCLRKNSLSIDAGKLRESGSIAQFFALYIDLAETNDPFDEFVRRTYSGGSSKRIPISSGSLDATRI